jgi:anti-sigma B factor antagonist
MATPPERYYFEWDDVGGIAVVRFTTPRLTDDRVIRQIFTQIEQMIEAGRSKIILNFGGLEAFASYAIGKLIVLNDKLKAAAGRLALCSLSPLVVEIIDIMNLRKRFHIYGNEQQALESFA